MLIASKLTAQVDDATCFYSGLSPEVGYGLYESNIKGKTVMSMNSLVMTAPTGYQMYFSEKSNAMLLFEIALSYGIGDGFIAYGSIGITTNTERAFHVQALIGSSFDKQMIRLRLMHGKTGITAMVRSDRSVQLGVIFKVDVRD